MPAHDYAYALLRHVYEIGAISDAALARLGYVRLGFGGIWLQDAYQLQEAATMLRDHQAPTELAGAHDRQQLDRMGSSSNVKQ